MLSGTVSKNAISSSMLMPADAAKSIAGKPSRSISIRPTIFDDLLADDMSPAAADLIDG